MMQKKTSPLSSVATKANHPRGEGAAKEEEEEKKMDACESHSNTVSCTSNDVYRYTPTSSAHPEKDTASSPSQQKHPLASRRSVNRIFRWLISMFLWIFLLEIPLLFSWSAYRGLIELQDIAHRYWIPQIALQEFTPHKAKTQLTYYHRVCDHRDLSAHDPSEFTIHFESESSVMNMNLRDEAVRLMNKHGAVAFPNLLSEETANQLRDFILQQNAISKSLIYVIENESRWSFPILVNQHPSVAKALQEILHNQNLVSAIEAIVGTNPAIIEFTAITSAYGAKGQFWHQDVTPDGNAAKYARHFIPSYSLFIPLQNTTARMGATGICPGSHMCAEGCRDYCEIYGFQISGKQDNWPLGTGAFVNQMTTHSGMAHTDPNAPHRVVFILTFAPRPLVSTSSSFSVETRNIGVSGSYSLHWSQWGHTLYDFRDPLERMAKYPIQRVMQSLGIYKPKHSQWGWDFITVNSCRIANSDTGYTVDDLDEFVEQGGFPWLPKQLQGTVNESTGWVDFLMETLQNCIQASRQVYVAVLAGAVSVNLLHALFWRSEGRGSNPGRIVFTLFRNLVRLLLIHGIVLVFIWAVDQRIENSVWARNIRSKKSFAIPESLAQTPDLPATLPTLNDVLILEGMQSEYLASFQHVLEVAHPGNNEWNEHVAYYSTGNHQWSSQLQKQVCQSLLGKLELRHQRILIQNKDSNWAEVTESRKQWFCHKSLLKKSNPWISKAVQQLDYLLSEARMGYWRETALQRRFISKRLVLLQDEILHFSRESIPNGNDVNHGGTWSNPWQVSAMIQHRQSARLSLPKDKRMPFCRPTHSRSSSIPSTQSNVVRSAPVVSYVNVGDIVEATFLDDQREWYRGRVLTASANQYEYRVRYDDGDEDDVCYQCVRPFVPYSVNETLEMRISENAFVPVRVIRVHRKEDTVDVELLVDDEDEDDIIRSHVPPVLLRRVVGLGKDSFTRRAAATSSNAAAIPLIVGDRVLARYPGEGFDEYYPGIVKMISPDGTRVSILYDDGDRATVRRKDVMLDEDDDEDDVEID